MPFVEWSRANPVLAWWVFSVSIALMVGSLIAMPIVVSRLRADYFVSRRPSPDSWSGQHPVLRWTIRIAKNSIGIVLVLAGIAMLVLPGQGLVTIFMGTTLIDFPGKRRFELRIVRQRPVLQAIHWIRARAGRPPLIVPERDGATEMR